MLFAYVYGYDDQLLRMPTFKSFDKLTDYGAEVCGNDENAKYMEVYRDGHYEGTVDFDVERDRALLNGYELPVHRKMLAKE